jgi:hypothetical protein
MARCRANRLSEAQRKKWNNVDHSWRLIEYGCCVNMAGQEQNDTYELQRAREQARATKH